jgi:hypothetical protein
MTEWKPILQGRPSRGEQRLLGSARIDRPRAGGAARMVAALGLASGVTATAGVSAASGASAGTAVLVKWLAIGAATGVVVTGTGEAVRYGIDANRDVRPVVQHVAEQTVPAPARPVDAPPQGALPDVPATEAEAARAGAEPRPRTEHARESLPVVPASPPTLAEEVRALDAVRKLLAAGDASGALRSLDDISRKFTQPRLGPEAAVLRQQARRQLQRQ